METTGKLIDATINYKSRKRQLTFEIDYVPDDELDRLLSLEKLAIKAVRHTNKRSKNANAYHWKLCGDIAKVLGAGIQETHKTLMLKYGSQSVIDGIAEYRITPLRYEPKETEYWLAGGRVHLNRKKGGSEEHMLWWVIKESHLYDSSEMSTLIDGTVSDAKNLGIETLPPWEVERLEREWVAYE